MKQVLIATAALLMGGFSASAGYQGETCLGSIATAKKILSYHEQDIPKAQVNTVLGDIAAVCAVELASRVPSQARHRRED